MIESFVVAGLVGWTGEKQLTISAVEELNFKVEVRKGVRSGYTCDLSIFRTETRVRGGTTQINYISAPPISVSGERFILESYNSTALKAAIRRKSIILRLAISRSFELLLTSTFLIFDPGIILVKRLCILSNALTSFL